MPGFSLPLQSRKRREITQLWKKRKKGKCVNFSVCPGTREKRLNSLWHRVGKETRITALKVLFFSSGWMGSFHHSYLVAAALQAHPSPFPAPCHCVSRSSSVSNQSNYQLRSKICSHLPVHGSTLQT